MKSLSWFGVDIKNAFKSPLNEVLDWLDFEVKTDEWEYQAFEILDQVIKETKSFWIFWLINIKKRTNFWCCEWNMLISDQDFKFLASNTICWWPHWIIFSHYLGILNDALQFLDDWCMNVSFFADHCIVLIVWVVSISKNKEWELSNCKSSETPKMPFTSIFHQAGIQIPKTHDRTFPCDRYNSASRNLEFLKPFSIILRFPTL